MMAIVMMKPPSSQRTGVLLLAASSVAATVTAVAVYWKWYAQSEGKKKREDVQEERANPATRVPPPVQEVQLLEEEDDDDTGSKRRRRRRVLKRGSVTIVHGSVTGTCARQAQQLRDALRPPRLVVQGRVRLGTIEGYDWWDELLNDDGDEDSAEEDVEGGEEAPPVLIVLLPTHTGGTWTAASEPLRAALRELETDWRIARHPLRAPGLRVAVFGMGSSEYGDDSMGRPAKEAAQLFSKLGARLLAPVQIGDDAVSDHARQTFDAWKEQLVQHWRRPSRECRSGSDGTCGACAAPAEEAAADDDDENDDFVEDDEGEPAVIDVEDMGEAVAASSGAAADSSGPREMVTPVQAAALTKEGYKLIGTHSAVKLCRWTKHQLRGRGGCYKHTFYGITSYQCMEATPSLACANKCVFCWRHHKNPVGKEWRWKTDDPAFIVEQAVNTHVKMIKETKGIPGVQMDRWKEAHTVRHCALSLVGEPIMYPRIDELLLELHRRKISTFLVTNGQHPNAIESLRPVTQLYVSVDAPTEKSLIAIDRPLFSDAWDRLKQSLSSLKDKGQRTVARLTVVKGWNSDEVEGYAKLIALGKVSLVEVKGVTFCGKSDASNLNMTNTPWHHEVVELTQTLKKEIDKLRDCTEGTERPPEYDLACEHRHSCSVLLARVDQFARDDPATGERRWRTWIDYDRFQELAERHAQDPSCTFSVEDYTAETPAWALFGSEEEGFDPTDKRHRRKKKHPMYTRFDERGVPTHDADHKELAAEERKGLAAMMDERLREIGSGSTVTELKGGAKEVLDASLMFRGMVVAK